jgi:hypothetical protein
MAAFRVVMLLAQAILVAGLGFALADSRVPLGVRGEWEWSRLSIAPAPIDLFIALAGVALYAGFAGLGWRSLKRRSGWSREGLWLLALTGAAVGIQVLVQTGAPYGYGLSKWSIALHNPGSSGYYTVARSRDMDDVRRFLANYPSWAKDQQVPRLGAHPPGLFLVTHGLIRAMEARPGLARRVLEFMPESVSAGFREIDRFARKPLPAADRAALALTGALTLVLCALTVVPLYGLARSCGTAAGAWSAAAFWPLVPAAILFQPTADTAFPFLSTTALALAVWAGRGRPVLAFAAGSTLALGMVFSLAFLPVGLVVGLSLATAPRTGLRKRLGLLAATGAGFLLLTGAAWVISGANPFLTWWWNRQNHARFYEGFPRSYSRWVVVNLIELGVAIGLPAVVWVCLGLSSRRTPRFVWSTLAVLAVLSFGGLTLSEVARLWLPYMPPLLVAADVGLERVEAGPWTVMASILLLGVQTLMMQGLIQVVYPV